MNFADYKIPIVDPDRYSGSYRSIPIDVNDDRYSERLVRLETVNVAYKNYHARTDGNNPPYFSRVTGSRDDIWIRKSVADKLASVNQILNPYGVELFVLDGYRPMDCQRSLWEFYYQNAKQKLGNASDEQYRAYTMKFVADPADFDESDMTTWPAHSTGGALDLTLRNITNNEMLDIGAIFEDINEVSTSDYFERKLAKGEIHQDDERLINRRLLHWAMNEQGFLNSGFVIWHYDWGNQTYIQTLKEQFRKTLPAAWYGYITIQD